MTIRHPRSVAAAAATATGLLLTACSSSGSPANTDTSATDSDRSGASATGATSAAATPLAATSATAHTSAAAQSAAGRSACTLITEHDVTASIGADPGAGSEAESHGATLCAYGSYAKQVLTVNVLPAQGRASYDRARKNPHLVSGTGLSVADVTGLGEQAFELSGPHTDALYFTKGETLIVVGLTAPTKPHTGAALALAKIAAGRL